MAILDEFPKFSTSYLDKRITVLMQYQLLLLVAVDLGRSLELYFTVEQLIKS